MSSPRPAPFPRRSSSPWKSATAWWNVTSRRSWKSRVPGSMVVFSCIKLNHRNTVRKFRHPYRIRWSLRSRSGSTAGWWPFIVAWYGKVTPLSLGPFFNWSFSSFFQIFHLTNSRCITTATTWHGQKPRQRPSESPWWSAKTAPLHTGNCMNESGCK